MQAPYDSLVQSLYYLDPEAVPDHDLDGPSQQHHEQDMRRAIAAHMLRRLRSQVSSFSPPTAEVVLPVMMTQQQRECYKAHLARAYEILTDPKTPRQNSHRGGQLRMVCSSLKKVGGRCCITVACMHFSPTISLILHSTHNHSQDTPAGLLHLATAHQVTTVKTATSQACEAKSIWLLAAAGEGYDF